MPAAGITAGGFFQYAALQPKDFHPVAAYLYRSRGCEKGEFGLEVVADRGLLAGAVFRLGFGGLGERAFYRSFRDERGKLPVEMMLRFEGVAGEFAQFDIGQVVIQLLPDGCGCNNARGRVARKSMVNQVFRNLKLIQSSLSEESSSSGIGGPD